MLVLSRRNQETVVVGGGGSFQGLLRVTVLEIAIGKVKLGFDVESDIPVHRLELWERLRASGEISSPKEDLPAPSVRSG